jgi:predicted nucleic acid-binding protein
VKSIFLDSGPLSLVAQRKGKAEADRCKAWLQRMIAAGWQVVVPSITDYEVRRELIRASKLESVARLDALHEATTYMALDKETMILAADLWAKVRREGRPTSDPLALDGDVILAAQALSVGTASDDVVVATTNVGHIARFVAACLWTEIEP